MRLPTRLLPGSGGLTGPAARRFADYARVPQVPIPPGRWLELPGRGGTWLTDTGPRDAPAVVLLHAIGCTGMLTWFPTVAELSKTYRVVTFDQRWHGRARLTGPDDAKAFSLRDCADDVAAVVTELGLDQPIVAGYSMGGVIAQRTWRRHPDLIGGLVLAATTARLRVTGPEMLFHQGMELANGTLRALEYTAVTRRMTRAAARRTAEALDVEPTPIGQWALQEFLSTSPWAVAQALAALGRHNSTKWLPSVDVPTAVVVTTRDRVIPSSRQRAMAALTPAAAVYDAACGHAGCVLRSAAFVPALLDAVDDVRARIAARPDRPAEGSEQRG